MIIESNRSFSDQYVCAVLRARAAGIASGDCFPSAKRDQKFLRVEAQRHRSAALALPCLCAAMAAHIASIFLTDAAFTLSAR